MGAVSLAVVATTAIAFGVAAIRSGDQPSRIGSEATQFALSASGITTSAFVSSGVLAAVAFVAARRQTRDVRERLRLGPTRASAAGLIAAIVGMVGLSIASGAASNVLGGHGRGTIGVIAHALERPTAGRFLVALATVAIAPGAAEETFFRGFIQTGLLSRLGRWPSIQATALAFALMHFDLVQGLVAFVGGLFLGWTTERFGGIRPSIAAHACNNAAFVALVSYGSATGTTRTGDILEIAAGLIAWAGATALIASRFALGRDERSLREHVPQA